MNSIPSTPGWARRSAIRLLIALAVMIVTSPFIEDLPHGDLIEAVVLTLVMVSAVHAVSDQRRMLLMALVLVTPVLVGRWGNQFRPDLLPPVVYLLPEVLFFGFVIAQVVRFLVRAPRVDANVICAAISGFLMLGLLWAPLYVMVARLDPGAFTLPSNPASVSLGGFDAFYFSFTTLSTVGYGDFVPASRAAKMLAVTEAISGLFYMAVLISRLVSVYAPSHRDKQ